VGAAAVPAAVPPVGAPGDAVVVQRKGWGFGTRFAVSVAVLATIAIVAFAFLHPSSLPVISRTAGGSQQTAAGTVAPSFGQPDTAAVNSSAVPYPASQFSAPAPNPGVSAYPQSPTPAPAPMPMTPTQPAAPVAGTMPGAVPGTVPSPIPSPTTSPTAPPTMTSTMPQPAGPPPTPLAPPTTRRHEPLTTTPPLRMPSADSIRAKQDSMFAKQDSMWAELDRTLQVHSVTTKHVDTMHTIPPVSPPIDTLRHTPPDSTRTGPSDTTRPVRTDTTLPPPDTTGTAGRGISNL
jgi:hypothetical protein